MEIVDKILKSISVFDVKYLKHGKISGLYIPESVEEIAENLIPNCTSHLQGLIKKDVDESSKEFHKNMLKKINESHIVVLPKSLKKIGKGAFKGLSNLKIINLPEGLEEIDAKAFYGCEALEQICIPTTLTKLGSGAFEKCGSLEKAILPKGLKIDKGDVFWDCSYVKFYQYSEAGSKKELQPKQEALDPHLVLSTDSLFYRG